MRTQIKLRIERKFVLLLLLLNCLFVFACQNKFNLRNPIEIINQLFVERDITDSESRFIGKSIDSNWKIETTKPRNIGVINDIFFIDDSNGWLIGAFGILYKTEDAGKNWKKINVEIPDKTSISKIVFANKNNGWMIVAKYNISILEAQNNQFWIMRTIDGGETWSSTYTEKASVFSEIRFANEKVGYLTGYKYANPEKKPIEAEGLLLKTEDTGESWTDISKEFNDFKNFEDAKSDWNYMNDSADNILFIAPFHIKMITHSRRVLETMDGGKTWKKVGQYSHDDQQVGIKNFGYKDDGTEWLLESTYSIEGVRARLKTRNTQNQIRRHLISGVYFSNAFYLSENNFIASGRTGNLRDDDTALIWQTMDDGKTWSEIYRNPKIKGIDAMIQVSKNSFWALCDDNTIIHVFQ